MTTGKLEEIEDIVCELCDGNDDDETIIIEIDSENRMELDTMRIYVPEYDLFLRTGVMSVLNKRKNEFEPDFAITAVYLGKDKKCENWVYYEQDMAHVTLHNYLRSSNIDTTGHPEYEGDCMCCALRADEEYVAE